MPRSFTQLTIDERRTVSRMLQAKARLAQIASVLGRHRSTVHREIKRNWWRDKEVPQADGYWHVTAHSLYEQRRRSYRKLHQHPQLRHVVIDRLKAGWSPEQIAGRLKREPDAQHRLCHETIYRTCILKMGNPRSLRVTCPSVVANASHAMHEGREALCFPTLWPFATVQNRSMTVASSGTGRVI